MSIRREVRTVHTLTRMVVEGYAVGAPTQEVEDMDASVAERHPCRKCGGAMRYEGYHKHSGNYSEYIALAVCDDCGHVVSF